MYEVKIYDNSGNLKRVISVRKLNARSKIQLESPHLFKRNKGTSEGLWQNQRKSSNRSLAL